MDAKSLQAKVEEQIMESYEKMYRLAFTYVKNEEDALDVVQESVYKAIKNASKIKQEQYIKTWLWRIVINTALDFIRSNRKEVPIEEILTPSYEDEYTDFDTQKLLNILDEKEKAVIVLRFFEDQKLIDIAGILDENVNTIKTILYRSLKKLKIELTEGELVYGR
ncbi:MAG: sigma-70 family RNA polymerase sigma factor [Lachnospiraceae bacterium]|nr:sigma-70 family RNA polymerase sigma factor [Lachnospiraceae bacterium]